MEENKIIDEEVKGEEVKTQESNLFRLDEMSDAIDVSMSNIKEVTEKQNQLIDILKEVNKEELKELIDSLQGQVDYMNIQYNELAARKENITFVLTECKANKEIGDLVDKLLTGLGIFKN